MMMIFSKKEEHVLKEEAERLGMGCFQTDNIYYFLRVAKEVKPEIVLMNFEKDFNNDPKIMTEIKGALCENGVCPKIYLNKPEDFEGEEFFENVDFEKEDVQKYLQ